MARHKLTLKEKKERKEAKIRTEVSKYYEERIDNAYKKGIEDGRKAEKAYIPVQHKQSMIIAIEKIVDGHAHMVTALTQLVQRL